MSIIKAELFLSIPNSIKKNKPEKNKQKIISILNKIYSQTFNEKIKKSYIIWLQDKTRNPKTGTIIEPGQIIYNKYENNENYKKLKLLHNTLLKQNIITSIAEGETYKERKIQKKRLENYYNNIDINKESIIIKYFTPDECKLWKNNKLINPKNGYKISKNKIMYIKIKRDCKLLWGLDN